MARLVMPSVVVAAAAAVTAVEAVLLFRGLNCASSFIGKTVNSEEGRF